MGTYSPVPSLLLATNKAQCLWIKKTNFFGMALFPTAPSSPLNKAKPLLQQHLQCQLSQGLFLLFFSTFGCAFLFPDHFKNQASLFALPCFWLHKLFWKFFLQAGERPQQHYFCTKGDPLVCRSSADTRCWRQTRKKGNRCWTNTLTWQFLGS